ncbi:MAG TPA: YaiO family outer membrane beta-barrel protein [Eudoraea sp.]|nr:YaiO family outer membrane beta-barrel protein [Eudoraea sp.]
MQRTKTYMIFFLCLFAVEGWSQEIPTDNFGDPFDMARELAFQGDHSSAREALAQLLAINPGHTEARTLLARTHSWDGHFDEARREFNKITSKERDVKEVWIAAVKNELYAKNDATALGLANKALYYLKKDTELEQLREMAFKNVASIQYKKYPKEKASPENRLMAPGPKAKASAKTAEKETVNSKRTEEREVPKNTLGVSNSFTIFSEVYEPNVSSRIDFKRQTRYGSIIPRISYSNRFQTHGLQYGFSAYPRIAKKMYAYVSYAYSKASIYPNHSVGGDLYASLPGAIEVSAGMRYLGFDTRDISIITNSLGLYKGNYYLSLRSYITPKSNNLTRVSGNLVIRKYLKDAENYLGVSGGIGFSPELKQIILDGTVLSETLLYLESQRLSFEYQFTGKNTPNIYKTRLGIARRELFSAPGSFLFSVSAGLTYKVKF